MQQRYQSLQSNISCKCIDNICKRPEGGGLPCLQGKVQTPATAPATAATTTAATPDTDPPSTQGRYHLGLYHPPVDRRRREFLRTPPPPPRPASRDAWSSVSPPAPVYIARLRLQDVGSSGYGRPRRSAGGARGGGGGGGGDGGARPEGEGAGGREAAFKVGRDRLLMVRLAKGGVAFERFPGEGGR